MLPLLGSEKPSAVRIIIGHIYFILTRGGNTQLSCNNAELSVQQMKSNMGVCWDLRALSLSDKGSTCNPPRSTEVPRPKHAVSEGSMTLAEDQRPEANLLIGLSQYALQCHSSQWY